MSAGTLIGILLALLYLGVAVSIVLNEQDSSSRLFWLFMFLVLPVAGIIVYSLAGYSYRSSSMRRRLHPDTLDYFREGLTQEQKDLFFPESGPETLPETCRPLCSLLKKVMPGNQLSEGNDYEIITSGARKRELLLEDIRQARHFIHLEYFRFGNDKSGREVRDLLARKVAEGVEVRLINNNIAAWRIPPSYFRNMRKMGIEVRSYTSFRYGFVKGIMRLNHQNHRKIVVIDGKVAYTGGMNLNDNYFCHWRDTHLRLTGPVVGSLQAAFIEDWRGTGGKLPHPLSSYFPTDLPAGEGPLKDKPLQVVLDAPEYPWPAMQMGYEWMLQNARDYVYIQTPYFVPPDGLLRALKGAALRGVDVRLMLPAKVDTVLLGPANRAFYAECLEAGIRLFERGGEFIHSKTLVCDDAVTVIGASNWDMRSFSVNNEVNTILYDRETTLRCKEIFLDDATQAVEFHHDAWVQNRRWYQDACSQFLRMFYLVL